MVKKALLVIGTTSLPPNHSPTKAALANNKEIIVEKSGMKIPDFSLCSTGYLRIRLFLHSIDI